MPTYDYRCPSGHGFEKFYKRMSAAPTEMECPECGAVASRQLSGGAGLLFKGSGFYLTDYGKNAHRTSGSESKSDSGGAKSEAPKSEGGAKSDTGGAKSDTPAPKAETAKPSKPKAE